MKRKKAAGLTAAQSIERQRIAYRKAIPVSREKLKDQIGLLLWLLYSPISGKQSVAGWQLLEVLLSQAYQGTSQSPLHGRDMAVESTISHRPE